MSGKKIQRKAANKDHPVTQREFSRTMTALKRDLDRVATKDDLNVELQRYATKDDLRLELQRYATKDDLRLELQQYATKNDLRQLKDEIIHEFKVVAENIHQDVAGANKDEISLIKDQHRQHGRRLVVIEKNLGIGR